MKIKKHANSRMRRNKCSKSRKGNNKGRGRLTKTRRMRGRGPFSRLSGLFGSAATTARTHDPSAGYAGKPEPVSNMPFEDSYGSGTYTGNVVKLPNGFMSRQGMGKMTYADGTMYFGEYQGNKRNGTGTIYRTGTTIKDIPGMYDTATEIRWNDDKPIMNSTYVKKCYQNDVFHFEIPVYYGETIAYPEFSARADDAIGLGGSINPVQIQKDLQQADLRLAQFADAMPKKPAQSPPPPVQTRNYDDLSPEDREKRAFLVADTQNSITKFDKLVKPNPNIKSRVKY